MKQTLIKVGHSLMVVVPAAFIREVGAKAKDRVEVTTVPNKGEIKIKFSPISQLCFSEDFFKQKKNKK